MDSFTPAQLAQIESSVRKAVREELADAGLRLDEPVHQDQAREDFRFLRRLRIGIDGIAAKIGWFVIAAVLGGFMWLFTAGLNAWRAMT